MIQTISMRWIAGILGWLMMTAFVVCGIRADTQTALSFERQGQWQQAEQAWRDTIQRNPQDGQAYAHLGLVLAHQNNYEQAVTAYRKAIALKTKLPGLQLDLGLALFKQEKLRDAISPLKIAVAEDPANMQAKILLSMCYFGTAKYAEAVPLLQAAVTANPENLQLRTTLAQSCLWSAHYDCTLEQYKRIIALSPESAQADMLAGEAFDGLGDAQGAIKQFEAAAAASPQEPNVHFGLGYLLFKQHQYEAAKTEFGEELKNDPNHAQALAYLGDTLIKLNQDSDALPLVEKAAKLPNPSRVAFVDLGILYTAQKRNAEAVAALQRAIALDPAQVDAHWRLARLYQSMGMKEEAKIEFDKARTMNEESDQALFKKLGKGRTSQP